MTGRQALVGGVNLLTWSECAGVAADMPSMPLAPLPRLLLLLLCPPEDSLRRSPMLGPSSLIPSVILPWDTR